MYILEFQHKVDVVKHFGNNLKSKVVCTKKARSSSHFRSSNSVTGLKKMISWR